MLPQKVYEALRWIIAIVMPALGLFIATLTNIWELDIPQMAVVVGTCKYE